MQFCLPLPCVSKRVPGIYKLSGVDFFCYSYIHIDRPQLQIYIHRRTKFYSPLAAGSDETNYVKCMKSQGPSTVTEIHREGLRVFK